MDCETGALHADGGRLVYPVSDEEYAAGGILGRFRDEETYRVAARKKIPHEVPEGVSASEQNRVLIVELLEEDPSCPALEEVLTEYRRPVVMTDEVLGELTLDKDYDTFEGVIPWRDEDIDISLEVDSSSEDTWTSAVVAMKQMVADQDAWDRDMRTFAARELTELARDWRESADEEVPEITEESFAQRLDQADRARPVEGRAEGGVRGQVNRGDAHEHAADVGDQPDRPHGDAEAVEASHGLVILAHEDHRRPRGVNDHQDDCQQSGRRVRGAG